MSSNVFKQLKITGKAAKQKYGNGKGIFIPELIDIFAVPTGN